MKVSVYNHNILSSSHNQLIKNTDSAIPSFQQQQGMKCRFKLKQLNELVESKSKQTKNFNKLTNPQRFPHRIYKNSIQTKEIYLRTQNHILNDLLRNLQRSKSRSGISIKSKQKITPFLQSKESVRTTTSSSKKQKLTLIRKLETQKITPFQQNLQTKQKTFKEQVKKLQQIENKENFNINANLDKKSPIQLLKLNQLKQLNNQKQRIYTKRPLKTTRQIIEQKMEKQKQKIKIKIDKKNYNPKTQRIRV